MAALGADDEFRLPTLVSQGWDGARQFTDAARQLWLTEPNPTNQLAETVARSAPDDRVAVLGEDNVGMSARTARERYGLPSLRDTIALDWVHASKLRTWTSGAAPFAQRTAPKPPALITLGAAVSAAVRWATLSTLLDPETPKDVQEGDGWLLAWAATPAWPEPATADRQARARLQALFRALVDAREPQKRLRLGAAVIGQHMAATALPAADCERWVWQRAKGYLVRRVHERPVVFRPPITGGEAAIEHLLASTLPSDRKWPEELTPLLGEVTRELYDELQPVDRRRILTGLQAKLATRAN
jgi:hypothetical protein